jgi:hypothetical protein
MDIEIEDPDQQNRRMCTYNHQHVMSISLKETLEFKSQFVKSSQIPESQLTKPQPSTTAKTPFEISAHTHPPHSSTHLHRFWQTIHITPVSIIYPSPVYIHLLGLQIRTNATANLPITAEIGNAVRMAGVIAGFNIIAAQLAVCDAFGASRTRFSLFEMDCFF